MADRKINDEIVNNSNEELYRLVDMEAGRGEFYVNGLHEALNEAIERQRLSNDIEIDKVEYNQYYPVASLIKEGNKDQLVTHEQATTSEAKVLEDFANSKGIDFQNLYIVDKTDVSLDHRYVVADYFVNYYDVNLPPNEKIVLPMELMEAISPLKRDLEYDWRFNNMSDIEGNSNGETSPSPTEAYIREWALMHDFNVKTLEGSFVYDVDSLNKFWQAQDSSLYEVVRDETQLQGKGETMNYNEKYAAQLKENSNFLFENYHLLPANVLAILSLVDDDTIGDYAACERISDMLKEVGWTAEYDLAGEFFDLKQLENWKEEQEVVKKKELTEEKGIDKVKSDLGISLDKGTSTYSYQGATISPVAATNKIVDALNGSKAINSEAQREQWTNVYSLLNKGLEDTKNAKKLDAPEEMQSRGQKI